MLQKLSENFKYSFRLTPKLSKETSNDGEYLFNTFHHTSDASYTHKATLEQWTKDELLMAVRSLELPHSKDLGENELINKIIVASNPLNITWKTSLGKQSVITNEYILLNEL